MEERSAVLNAFFDVFGRNNGLALFFNYFLHLCALYQELSLFWLNYWDLVQERSLRLFRVSIRVA